MSKYYLNKGNYDRAVKEAVKKLRKNSSNEKQIEILKKAYTLSNSLDSSEIAYLHKEGQPDRWDKIFKLYSNMEIRQVLVENITPLHLRGQKIMFKHVDYDQKIIEAKYRAAAYYYAHGKKLLESNNKFLCRQAYDEFTLAKSYNSAYSDVDKLIEESYQKGLSRVAIVGINNTPFQLPQEFMISLIDHPVGDLNSVWIKYYTKQTHDIDFDLYIDVNLVVANVSNNNMDSKEHIERREVEDGWEYVRDSNGRFVTDSTGQKIKTSKYKTISCRVLEIRQFKRAHIEAVVNYTDVASNQVIRREPVATDYVFEHFYAKADGDLGALSEENYQKINSAPMPFPLDLEMLYGANGLLRNLIFQVLIDNRHFVEQKY